MGSGVEQQGALAWQVLQAEGWVARASGLQRNGNGSGPELMAQLRALALSWGAGRGQEGGRDTGRTCHVQILAQSWRSLTHPGTLHEYSHSWCGG